MNICWAAGCLIYRGREVKEVLKRLFDVNQLGFPGVEYIICLNPSPELIPAAVRYLDPASCPND